MITFGGLATGIDTKSLISGLVAAERVPLDRIGRKQSGLVAAQNTLAGLVSKISALGNAAEDLSDMASGGSLTASSSDPKVVATAHSGAVAGNISVEVVRVASEQRSQSGTFASSTAALGQSGTMSITRGTAAPVDVTIAAGDSLVAIAAKINAKDAGVNASVVSDNGSYRLLVRSNETGTANAFTVSGVALGLDQSGSVYRQAEDAEILVDGEFSMVSGKNLFRNVVAGVDVAISGAPAGAVEVGVSRDSGGLKEKVKALVEAFNSAVDGGHKASGFSSIAASHPELAGDSAIRSAMSQLGAAIGTPAAGMSGRYNMLASIGVHLTRDGKLQLDETKLDAAIADDSDAVHTLLAGDSDKGITGAMSHLKDVVDRLSDGDESMLGRRKRAMGREVDHLDEITLNMERRLDDYEAMLVKKFAALEKLVSQIQSQEGALAGLVNMKNES